MHPYVTLGAADIDQARRFYDAVLGPIGWKMHMAFEGWRAYSEGGTGEGFTFWICRPFDGHPASVGNGTMVALPAPSRAAVDACYQAAMDHGGTDEGKPGLREHYGPNWYATYVRDPSGNKLGFIYNA